MERTEDHASPEMLVLITTAEDKPHRNCMATRGLQRIMHTKAPGSDHCFISWKTIITFHSPSLRRLEGEGMSGNEGGSEFVGPGGGQLSVNQRQRAIMRVGFEVK